MYAQWTKLAYLTLKNPSANGKAGALVSPSAYSYQYFNGNALDVNTTITVRAQPNSNYHLSRWSVVHGGQISTYEKSYDPRNPAKLSAYDLETQLTADMTVTPIYSIDGSIVNVNVVGENSKVDVVVGTTTYIVEAGH